MVEQEFCTVYIGEEQRRYPKGTTYQQIANDFQEQYDHDIVLVFVDKSRLQELGKTIQEDRHLSFVTTGQTVGQTTYRRSMSLMMIKAVHDVGGKDGVNKVRIQFSVDKGFYCTIEGSVVPDEEFLQKVEMRMREMVEKRIPIEKRSPES